jgi:hypothetical protein
MGTSRQMLQISLNVLSLLVSAYIFTSSCDSTTALPGVPVVLLHLCSPVFMSIGSVGLCDGSVLVTY